MHVKRFVIPGLIALLALFTVGLTFAQVNLARPYFNGNTVYINVSSADGEGTKRGIIRYRAAVYDGRYDDAGKMLWDTEGSVDYEVDSTDTLTLFSVSSDYSGKLMVINLNHEDESGDSDSWGPYRMRVP